MKYDINYKKKLEQFNATSKYKYEMCFIENLVNPQKDENILDYGCGLGTIVLDLKEKFPESTISGYDKYQYTESSSWFINEVDKPLDKVYFMHSISHIEYIQEKLKILKNNLSVNSKIYVLTPNRNWIEMIRGSSENKHYIPDPTLVRDHFSPIELEMLFTDLDFRVEMIGQIGKEHNGAHERLFIKVGL